MDGYTISIEKHIKLPGKARSYIVPDILARKGKEVIAVECEVRGDSSTQYMLDKVQKYQKLPLKNIIIALPDYGSIAEIWTVDLAKRTIRKFREAPNLREKQKFAKYVRETAPITEREQLLVTLYERGATNKEDAIPAKAFSNKQREILDQLAIEQRIVITTEGLVLLTELGLMIAKGIRLIQK